MMNIRHSWGRIRKPKGRPEKTLKTAQKDKRNNKIMDWV